jgi:hypothetical protein
MVKFKQLVESRFSDLFKSQSSSFTYSADTLVVLPSCEHRL